MKKKIVSIFLLSILLVMTYFINVYASPVPTKGYKIADASTTTPITKGENITVHIRSEKDGRYVKTVMR